MPQEYEGERVEPEENHLCGFLKRRWLVEKIRGLTYEKTIKAAAWAMIGGLGTFAIVEVTFLFLGFSRVQTADIALGPGLAATLGIYSWKLTK